MKPELRKKIIEFNISRAEDKAKADDLMILLNALPKGQVKQLFKNEVCAEILTKYGITSDE